MRNSITSTVTSILPALIFGLFICISDQTAAVAEDTHYSQIGIHITKAAFDQLMEEVVGKMKEDAHLAEKDYITMVRIFNTVATMPDLERSSRGSEFTGLFKPKYMLQSVEKLDAHLTKGMAFYSVKHDLFIGGSQHANSRFVIE